MKIKVREVRPILTALQVLTGGTHSVVTKLSNGDSSSANLPYSMEDHARWNALKNLRLADQLLKDAANLIENAQIEVAGGVGIEIDKDKTPTLWIEYTKRLYKIEEDVKAAPFLRIKLSELKVSTSNPIPGSVIAALGPLLVDDTPAPKEDEFIAD